jgi:hypothetical protein
MLRAGLGFTQSGPNLGAIRDVVADELARVFNGVQVAPSHDEHISEQEQLEEQYGAKLDQMLGGLSRGRSEDSHEG